MTSNTTYYKVPEEYWYRIHFVRPRFKSNIENVLLYMAGECCKIPPCKCEEYSQLYRKAIRAFPGNIDKSEKTIDNWRTEIPALFAFYTEDKATGTTKTSQMARFLHENQDLTQFLRLFLYSFQFPGGHIRSDVVEEVIRHGIKFKPARTIVQVLLAGNEILGGKKEMSLSKEEATYCIFNDTRVTSGVVSAESVAKNVLRNRKNRLKYYNTYDTYNLSLTGKARTEGDVTRYAGDILDYMEIANLLVKRHGYYYLKPNEVDAIKTFASDHTWFNGYDCFYSNDDWSTAELSRVEPLWFDYMNRSMKPDFLKTDLRIFIEEGSTQDAVFDERIQDLVYSADKKTKDTGNLGEAIICGHEKMRLKINGRSELVRLVQIVDSPSYHPGYDIDSFEAEKDFERDTHRYIEVKTTISKRNIQMYGFHMSRNEWSVAETIKEHYCVYRLMLSEKEKILYILRDPVRLYKTDRIDAQPGDGMDITFSAKTFKQVELLKWKK